LSVFFYRIVQQPQYSLREVAIISKPSIQEVIKMLDYSAITKAVLRKRLSGNPADHSENLLTKAYQLNSLACNNAVSEYWIISANATQEINRFSIILLSFFNKRNR